MRDLDQEITNLRAEREGLIRALQTARAVLEELPVHCPPDRMRFLRLVVEAVKVIDAALKEIAP
jgi:hypothetical protein